MKSAEFFQVFNQSIKDYHINDSIETEIKNPYSNNQFEHLLYQKNWIDTVQWHLEDIIRDPEIEPIEALKIKRVIDASNQKRTDLVEFIDGYFLNKYKDVKPNKRATLNSETIAWALDRLSILALKIFHMFEEVNRESAEQSHKVSCQKKLDVLNEQKLDLSKAIDQLIDDIEKGNKYMKIYKQMKMYNDEELNPVLYKAKK
ncbi:DUF4254 domain-containing protein [Flavobacteriaceae bacterium]|nr:DUF4254 domain-containing protein [Flavobacteriaceae bacterium]MDA9000287.1 DUF4254 domain-containing protein [Flavobacteriaceae bacterium]MDB2648156.1 DUF4254 domain-containing protein [Flavobacteriaceae bacterium]MDB4601929.1 DUF4254 domain-containing protein [Flavobacteriaceae bacterium]MDB9847127.1 DUF4254 domain-containing protein [Flavobacteriaceae bacterium]